MPAESHNVALPDRLNEKRRFVRFEAFYNETLNDQLEIKEDFPQFKDRKGYDDGSRTCECYISVFNFAFWNRFSFCDYPFILNPATKADILKVESMFQMRHELQDAFFRALFQGEKCSNVGEAITTPSDNHQRRQ
jgi:ubiquitin-protein ligase E3 A